MSEVRSSADDTSKTQTTRRGFLRRGGELTTGAALAAGFAVPQVHAGEDNTIRLALIGAGGRGGGAVRDAMDVASMPLRLHAAADIFPERLSSKLSILQQHYPDRVDVPPERQFVGFDAYRKAIDSLRPGDIAMLTAYAYSRPAHLAYAVQKGVHVFMEKPFSPDPAGLHAILKAGELAEQKNLKVAAGLMCRHSKSRQALMEQLRAGELGEIHLIRSYRRGRGSRLPRRKTGGNELTWQMRNSGHFFWLSSGRYVEWLIHQVDECCWLKNSHPMAANGSGGQVDNHSGCSQNLDLYAVEYTYADGAKAYVTYRGIDDCDSDFATYVHGTRCAAQFSGMTHRATVHRYHDQRIGKEHVAWTPPAEDLTPWQAEWQVLLDAIVNDRPHNETRRAVFADYASIMGRAAVHTGRTVTWDQVTQSDFQFCPDVESLDYDSTPPVRDAEDGRFPVPIPGQWVEL